MWRLGDAVGDLTNRFLDLIIFSDLLWSFVLVYVYIHIGRGSWWLVALLCPGPGNLLRIQEL